MSSDSRAHIVRMTEAELAHRKRAMTGGDPKQVACCYYYGPADGDRRNAQLCMCDPGAFKIGDRIEALKHNNRVDKWAAGSITAKFMAGGLLWAYDDFYPLRDIAVMCRGLTCQLFCTHASSRFWRYDIEYDDLKDPSDPSSKDRDERMKGKYIRAAAAAPTSPAACPAAPEQQLLART